MIKYKDRSDGDITMFPIEFNHSYINGIIDIILSLAIIAFIIIFCKKSYLSKKVLWTAVGFIICFIIAAVFDLLILKGMLVVAICVLTTYVSLLMTSSEKNNELRHHKKVAKKENSLTTNEEDELISNITKAVTILSSTQTGALITIERLDDLKELMEKSGTKINAPLTPELLCTIFYKGTPLHDGATIIKGNMIVSSAVFFQPTQRPLNGKYGSRHRAAIGISEVYDALTIVVSEETGTISLSYKGELISIPLANFKEKFTDYYHSSINNK